MTRKQILSEVKRYFQLKELVCPHAYNKFGDRAWQFLDTEYLHTLLTIRRDILKRGMTCNTYHAGAATTQRGLRCNVCAETKSYTARNEAYLSAHINGAGGDFIVTGMTAEQARQTIKANEHLLPYPIRLEKGVTWLHFDCYDYDNGKKINEF